MPSRHQSMLLHLKVQMRVLIYTTKCARGQVYKHHFRRASGAIGVRVIAGLSRMAVVLHYYIIV